MSVRESLKELYSFDELLVLHSEAATQLESSIAKKHPDDIIDIYARLLEIVQMEIIERRETPQ